MIHGDRPVVFNEDRAGIALLLGVRVNGVRQIAPVDQIVAHRVPPMPSSILGRPHLVEQVPPPLPEAKTVRIVQRPEGARKMIGGPQRISGAFVPSLAEAPQKRIVRKLVLLFLQCGCKAEPRCPRPVVRGCFGGRGLASGT